MTFDEYQAGALRTAFNKNPLTELPFRILGLVGEAGEVAEKYKKIYRDKGGKASRQDLAEIKKEIGDVLWYCATLADIIGFKLDDIAAENLAKLRSRERRGKLAGKGDNR
jgi:NTP pyrophosphatase (non-canonical NTP hydrolase)